MTASDIIELNLRYGCSEIGIPTVIDYIHEVEHRANMESQELANKHQKLEEEVAEIKAVEKGTLFIPYHIFYLQSNSTPTPVCVYVPCCVCVPCYKNLPLDCLTFHVRPSWSFF